jgi:hypothetical protein
MFLVRDNSANPKVWATDGITRRWVSDGAEAAMWDGVLDAFEDNDTSRPNYPNYPVVSALLLFRLPETLNVS